jgi:tetratricopeptide (TPR) repeat protein
LHLRKEHHKKVRRRRCLLPVATLVVLAVVSGCVSTGQLNGISQIPMTGRGQSFHSKTAEKELSDVRRLVNAGDHATAVPRLIQIMQKYNDRETSMEARFWLGVCYYNLNTYRDAIDMFKEYIREAPEGPRADSSREYIAKLQTEYEQQYGSPEELDSQIQAAQRAVQANPGSVEDALHLADLLWKRGTFTAAGEIYVGLVRKHPEIYANEPIARRIEILPSGEFTILTPTEIQRREVEQTPLVIENQHAFRRGRDLFTRERLFYVVTGQAHNRSDSVLYGVEVLITLYGQGNIVYDSRPWHVGRLNPGERRAFSVRFDQFETIENIQRFECVGSFQR